MKGRGNSQFGKPTRTSSPTGSGKEGAGGGAGGGAGEVPEGTAGTHNEESTKGEWMIDVVALVAAMLAGLVVFGVVLTLGTPWARDDSPPSAERMT